MLKYVMLLNVTIVLCFCQRFYVGCCITKLNLLLILGLVLNHQWSSQELLIYRAHSHVKLLLMLGNSLDLDLKMIWSTLPLVHSLTDIFIGQLFLWEIWKILSHHTEHTIISLFSLSHFLCISCSFSSFPCLVCLSVYL